MELKNHWQIIKKYRWLIPTVAVILMLAGFLIGLPQQAKFETTISFDIYPLGDSGTPEDNYYSLQGSRLVGDTLMSWTLTPDVVNSIFTESNIAPAEHNIDLENYFHAKRYSPQNVVIKFTSNDKQMAEKLADNLTQIFQKKSAELKGFQISPSEPIMIDKKVNPKLYGGIGLIVGIFSGVILSYLLWYFKEN